MILSVMIKQTFFFSLILLITGKGEPMAYFIVDTPYEQCFEVFFVFDECGQLLLPMHFKEALCFAVNEFLRINAISGAA